MNFFGRRGGKEIMWSHPTLSLWLHLSPTLDHLSRIEPLKDAVKRF